MDLSGLEAEVKKMAEERRDAPGAVPWALKDLQEKYGHLPEEGLRILAKELGVPLSQVFGAATFFAFFRLAPKGRHHLEVCMGTACHVLGAARVVDKVKRDTGLGPGQVSGDGELSLDTVRCLGCCGLAPVVVMDGEVRGRVRQKEVGRLLRPSREVEGEG